MTGNMRMAGEDRGILPTFLILTILIPPMIPDKLFSRFFR